jgi:hypothetical protein
MVLGNKRDQLDISRWSELQAVRREINQIDRAHRVHKRSLGGRLGLETRDDGRIDEAEILLVPGGEYFDDSVPETDEIVR